MSRSPRSVIIFIILFILSAQAFHTRHINFAKSDSTTIDEEVYYILGHQLKSNWQNYNTIEYARWLQEAKDFSLPEYFYRPLFKHPPLFPFLITIFLMLFGDNLISAVYVAGLFGALLIPLGYFLGQLTGGWLVGLLTAVLIWLDPVNMMCSQKIWLDTPLAFFMVLSIYFYLKAVLQNRTNFFIFAGIAAGLAMLTKYSGILAILTIYLSALITRPHLSRNRKFLFSLSIPFIMSLPWFFWNVAVYGQDVFSELARMHSFLPRYINTPLILSLLSLVLLFPILAQVGKRLTLGVYLKKIIIPSFLKNQLQFAIWLIFALLLFPAVVKALRLDILPATSWDSSIATNDDRLFYVFHLLEFSLFFIFAYISLINLFADDDNILFVFRVFSLLIIIFYSIWGSYQSRYILPALPILTVLAAHQWLYLFRKSSCNPQPVVRFLFQGILLFFIFFSTYKMWIINTVVSAPNNMCYF